MVKKVLCALLAFCLLFAVMPRNTALAADEAQIVVGSASAKPGEDVTVSVSFKNNPGIIAFSISIGYDSEKLELKEANTAEGAFSSASFGPLTANPFSILWDESTSPDVSGDATAATLTFGVKDAAAAGDSAISVTYEAGNIYNYSMQNVSFETVNGTVTIAPKTYTVSFNANGGEGSMNDQTFTDGEAQTLTANAFTRSGYNFSGWNTVANGSGSSYTDGQSVTATDNMTLYAQWTPTGTYSVSMTDTTGAAGYHAGDSVSVDVAVSGGKIYGGKIALSYDAAYLKLTGASLASGAASDSSITKPTDANGAVNISLYTTGGVAADTSFATLTFEVQAVPADNKTVIQVTSAEIATTSNVYQTDATAAVGSLSLSIVYPTYSVTLSEGLSGASTYTADGSTVYTATISGYDASAYVYAVAVKVGNSNLASDKFTVSGANVTVPAASITGNMTVTLTKTPIYTVTLSEGLSGASTYTADRETAYTATISDYDANAYDYTVTVKIGDTTLASDKFSVSGATVTVPAASITGNMTITLTKAFKVYNVTLSGGLSGASTYTADGETAYTATIIGYDASAYVYTVTVKVGDTTLASDKFSVSGATVSVPAASITGDMTVTLTKTPIYAVTLSDGLNGASTYTVDGETAYTATISDYNATLYNYTVAVTVGGTTLTSGYTVSGATVTIPAASITGNVTITLTATVREYSVTLNDGLSGNNAASGLSDYSATISDYNADAYSYVITVTVGGTTLTSGYTVSGATVSIPAASITGNITITLTKTLKATVTVHGDYVTGWYLVVAESAIEGKYQYNGSEMFRDSYYDAKDGGAVTAYAYAWLVKSDSSLDADTAKSAISFVTGSGGADIVPAMAYDVNSSGKIDFNDLYHTYRGYNKILAVEELSEDSMAASVSANMGQYLALDVNKDHKVNAVDLAAIQSSGS